VRRVQSRVGQRGRGAGKPPEVKELSTARSFWEGWKRFGKKIADIQARALLTFFYFVLLSPFALAVRWWSDPLAIKTHTSKGWCARDEGNETSKERAARQF